MKISYLSVMGLLILGCNSNIDLGARDGGARDGGAPNSGNTGGQTSSIPAVCGDGKLGSNEPCDDSNAASGDGCSATCTIESGYVCPTPGQPCILSQCGDGIAQAADGEQCDYGAVNNDGSYGGCTAACQVGPYCGDGIKNGPEQCDNGSDANDGSYGSCTAACKLSPYCGDGMVSGPEQCDLGAQNGAAGSTCSTSCKPSTAVCGDGKVEADESCDDGNMDDGDGCGATCTIEPQWSCPTPGQPCAVSACGDGTVQAGEQCDNGAANNSGGYNTCSPACTFGPYCGDGTVNGPEECDMAAANGTAQSKCTLACKIILVPPN